MKRISFGFVVLVLACCNVFAQQPGWYHLDPERDTIYGISTGRAYAELLKNKSARKVIVAIIDCGIDTLQEDLTASLWTDPLTGLHGWNFIGAETGKEDIVKLTFDKKRIYDSLQYTTVPESYRASYQAYRKIYAPSLKYKIAAMQSLVYELEEIKKLLPGILAKTGKENPTADDFKNYPVREETQEEKTRYDFGMPNEPHLVKNILRRISLYPDWKTYRYHEIDRIQELARYHLDHGLNQENNEKDTALGNADITPDKLGPVHDPNIGGAYHGTHVAGIIAAQRNNGTGLDGIADNVQIMMLKENGTIREMRDEALARAIRFAVNHGAKIINLSFGKPYTWNKKLVDDAVKYAMEHDVLLVHAAGNTGENLDSTDHYPNPACKDKSGTAKAWLEVGASDSAGNAANFSNYGKRDVDIFAPGVGIYSTLPFNQYQSWDGTSMAAPMVSGVAALIREYYPGLTAIQVRDIIIKSVVKRESLKEKCAGSGVVNAYNALKLAATYK